MGLWVSSSGEAAGGPKAHRAAPWHRMVQPRMSTALRLKDSGLEERSSCGPGTPRVQQGQNCSIMMVRWYLRVRRGLPQAAHTQAEWRSHLLSSQELEIFAEKQGHVSNFLFWKTQLFSIKKKVIYVNI